MILLALGSSLTFNGRPPEKILTAALEALDVFCRVKARSRLYLSPSWPDPSQPAYINAAAAIETGLEPEALLAGLHALEAGFGRRRSAVNAPRTLDLDLLDYHGRVTAAGPAPSLVLPHPRLHERDFVLAPLAEIAPGWRHPVSGETVEALLARLPAQSARPL